jgi:hypothetical protein
VGGAEKAGNSARDKLLPESLGGSGVRIVSELVPP